MDTAWFKSGSSSRFDGGERRAWLRAGLGAGRGSRGNGGLCAWNNGCGSLGAGRMCDGGLGGWVGGGGLVAGRFALRRGAGSDR